MQVVLSDMSEPWPQTHGFSVNSLSNPYIRMMNTSGIAFKDHAGSMVGFSFSLSLSRHFILGNTQAYITCLGH
jgi:23S rRNA U2552 (ribose-2'-O)-methylase RlmE/FtsJ